MTKKAVFPGTFDPITIGHVDIIKRGLKIFDEVVVAIGKNTSKKHLNTLETRVKWINDIFRDEPRVKVDHYAGLTVDYCKFIDAKFILRGLRSVTDFEYEEQIAHVNRQLYPNIETVFIMSDPVYSSISSTLVRDIILYGGDYKKFVPDEVRILS